MVCLETLVRAHKFGDTGRLTHSHSDTSFYGTRFYQQLPGPGRYDTNASTLRALEPLSKTRLSDWPRRYRNCRPLQGSQATASLSGVDSLLEVPSPAPGSYRDPDSTFNRSLIGHNYWSAGFASRSARFPPTRRADDTITRHLGEREMRSFHRTLPSRPRHTEISLLPHPSSANIYCFEEIQTSPFLERPNYLTVDTVSSAPPGYYEHEDNNDIENASGTRPPMFKWAQPSRGCPELAQKSLYSTGGRSYTAAELLAHRAKLTEFKSDVRAVRQLENFKLPRSEFRV